MPTMSFGRWNQNFDAEINFFLLRHAKLFIIGFSILYSVFSPTSNQLIASLLPHPGRKLIDYFKLQEEEHEKRKALKANLLVKLMTNNSKIDSGDNEKNGLAQIGGYDAIRLIE